VTYLPLGAHLVGSVPLGSAEEVFLTASAALGDRLRRIPDGETGPRADWIVWQYSVLSARPQFEVGPPAPTFYRALPRLRVHPGEDPAGIRFGALGYAVAALGSYEAFRRLKRDGAVPLWCRLQVCLPTPLAPISAFVSFDDQAAVEPAYEAAIAAEVAAILEAIPHDQLALQWDTNFEFSMLDGDLPAWFPDVKGGILERLIRLSRLVPPDVELGFHFCYGDGKDAGRHPPRDMARLVEIANWIHMPAAREAPPDGFLEPLHDLRLGPETELYLGVLLAERDHVQERIDTAHELAGEFGLATVCGWGRLAPSLIPDLLRTHAELSRPVADRAHPRTPFTWGDVARIPAEDWVEQPVEEFGLKYDTVENHGWYRNLDPTVEQLAGDLEDGQILIDYSGGTGILLDRLLLRIFDRQVGMMIVDSSAKFLRVALERFVADERVAFRLLRYLREEKRLQELDEVVDRSIVERGADAIVSTNAIHLYYDLENTLRSWTRVLKPGGRVYVNSGNLRNPRARENEWIIDETVYVMHEIATGLVRTDPRYAPYKDAVDDEERMQQHLAFRDRVFLAPRPLSHYLDALRVAGLEVEDVGERTIEADVEEWYEFLSTYHDAVLGWVGGSLKVDGVEPSAQAVEDRLSLMRESLDTIFGGRSTFRCCWTYILACKP
jgi:ubiquinone/menaquinone biosynthesis C-methylase UbiE